MGSMIISPSDVKNVQNKFTLQEKCEAVYTHLNSHQENFKLNYD